jgi:hypothetical protein
MYMLPDIPTRMSDFKADLTHRTSAYMVRHYTTFAHPAVLTERKYFELKSDIADKFKIHPSEIVMVGSGKLGFSIKPQKRYELFGDESDIDIAIISPTLFDTVWQIVFDYAQTDADAIWERKTSFIEYLFQGWIRPDKLPQSYLLEFAKDWWKFFNTLTRTYKSFPIKGGLYKSWYHFERYQSRAVDACKQAMEL